MENLKPRQSAVRILHRVVDEGKIVDDAIALEKEFKGYSEADKHFITLLVLTALRRLGEIRWIIAKVLKKPLPKKQQIVQHILELAVAQYLYLKTPEYAIVNTAVSLVRKFHIEGYTGLVNGVLRHIIRLPENEKKASALLNIPEWLKKSWEKVYGVEKTEKIAAVLTKEPTLDISVKENPNEWAKKWNGQVVVTGSVRVSLSNPRELEGFASGDCWVQNAAASVPAQLFHLIKDKKIADLCAAPGGKTAQLAYRGAQVVAFDISSKRLERLKENMERLGLSQQVDVIAADIASLDAEGQFDAVLLDAPCSATGTLTRHPEIKYHRTLDDVKRLSELQKQLLKKAVALVKQGGEVVFSTCSLQPEEGDEVIKSVAELVDIVRPIEDRWKPFITEFGSLRFFPDEGYDGFYVCLMRKK